MSKDLPKAQQHSQSKASQRTGPQWAHLQPNYLILEMKDFIVFLDDDWDVDWETSDTYDLIRRDIWKTIGAVLNEVSRLQAIPVAHLTHEQRLGFRRMLGEAVARALEGCTDDAESILTAAKEYAVARNHEHARLWYLSSSAVSAGLLLSAALALWMGRVYLTRYLGPSLLNTLIAAGVGAIGALLSTYRRVAQLPLDPSAGRVLHYFEGTAHVVLGSIGGGIVWLSSASGIIAPQLLVSTHGRTFGLLLCIVGGASERLVPSLMARVESAVLSPSTAKDDSSSRERQITPTESRVENVRTA